MMRGKKIIDHVRVVGVKSISPPFHPGRVNYTGSWHNTMNIIESIDQAQQKAAHLIESRSEYDIPEILDATVGNSIDPDIASLVAAYAIHSLMENPGEPVEFETLLLDTSKSVMDKSHHAHGYISERYMEDFEEILNLIQLDIPIVARNAIANYDNAAKVLSEYLNNYKGEYPKVDDEVHRMLNLLEEKKEIVGNMVSEFRRSGRFHDSTSRMYKNDSSYIRVRDQLKKELQSMIRFGSRSTSKVPPGVHGELIQATRNYTFIRDAFTEFIGVGPRKYDGLMRLVEGDKTKTARAIMMIHSQSWQKRSAGVDPSKLGRNSAKAYNMAIDLHSEIEEEIGKMAVNIEDLDTNVIKQALKMAKALDLDIDEGQIEDIEVTTTQTSEWVPMLTMRQPHKEAIGVDGHQFAAKMAKVY